jgi:hypothetical protein
MKLSNQALGAVMLTLQKGLLDQIDVTGILRNLDFFETVHGELDVKNPPTFEIASQEEIDA